MGEYSGLRQFSTRNGRYISRGGPTGFSTDTMADDTWLLQRSVQVSERRTKTSRPTYRRSVVATLSSECRVRPSSTSHLPREPHSSTTICKSHRMDIGSSEQRIIRWVEWSRSSKQVTGGIGGSTTPTPRFG